MSVSGTAGPQNQPAGRGAPVIFFLLRHKTTKRARKFRPREILLHAAEFRALNGRNILKYQNVRATIQLSICKDLVFFLVKSSKHSFCLQREEMRTMEALLDPAVKRRVKFPTSCGTSGLRLTPADLETYLDSLSQQGRGRDTLADLPAQCPCAVRRTAGGQGRSAPATPGPVAGGAAGGRVLPPGRSTSAYRWPTA